jgi:hypothetical protein
MAYGEPEIKLHTFLTPYKGGPIHDKDQFNTNACWPGGWVDTKSGWDALKQRKSPALLEVLTSDSNMVYVQC